MKKLSLFRFSAGALLLGLLIYFTACVKEQTASDLTGTGIDSQIVTSVESSIIPLVPGEAVDRGCSPCTGRLSIFTNNPENTPFTAQLQSRACPQQPWVTEMNILGNVPFNNNSFQVGHEKYYRIILTNNGTQTRNFTSSIQNPPGLGNIAAFLGTIPPMQSVAVTYNGKGNCGCGWIYDCSSTEQ